MPKPAKQSPATHPREGGRGIEWVVGIASGVLVLAMMLYLAYEALFLDGEPPSFAIVMERSERHDDGFHVTVAVTNTGDETASNVEIAGLQENAGDADTSLEFDYVPGRSVRRGTFVFQADPETNPVRFTVRRHVEP
ncbi:hypothetical protein [Mesorhizobium sp. CAU 1732]|uniref:hypothetical protein n=1 Tax=Mesorhizobium sp. CAU 1732 TaxID=3140358 RepID=UPI0032611027